MFNDTATNVLNLIKSLFVTTIHTATMIRNTGVATVTTATPHGLVATDIITITGCTNTTFNVVNSPIIVINTTTFTYASTGTNTSTLTDANGLISTDDFKSYFDGDPVWIPTSYLPAIIVTKTNGSTQSGATGLDVLTETIAIRIVLNLNSYMGASNVNETAHKFLKTIVEARQSSGQYATKSLLGILRTQFTLSNSIVNQKFDVTYDILTEGRVTDKKGVTTEEAHVVFTVTQFVPVPTRT
jgi:hypothetical protein